MKLSPKAKKSLQVVVDKFQAGDLSPVIRVFGFKLPEGAPARNWTFSNRVMAMAQTGALDCRGYRQWQKAGRQVRKGARAGFILFPLIVTKDKGTSDERQQCVGFSSTPVFSIEDTEGEDIDDYTPAELPPLMEVAERLGVDVAYMPLEGALGYCTADNTKIRLASHDESVFFHELAHAAHNTWEINQSGGQDKHRETVAELCATVLMHLYGLQDHTGNAWKYISHYNKDPLKAIMSALGDVEKVLGVIYPQGEGVAA